MGDYTNKSIAVIGMARTGMAVAEATKSLGAHVVLYDRKSASDLAEALETVRELGVEARPDTGDVDLTGVDILVPSPGVPRTAEVFAEAERRGVEVISEIELAYRLSRAPIIAITGTNGKTTTTVLTARMLMADGRRVHIAGNVAGAGERLGGSLALPESDQPVPLVAAAARASAEDVIVAEISTFQLEWVSDFRPNVAALLNVTSDHMDRHASVDEYAALKARIFENQGAGDFSVINAENLITAGLAPTLRGRVLRFARLSEVEEGGFLRGDDLVVRLDGGERVVCSRSDIRLRGEHNVENVLASACMAIAFGARPQSIRAAVREFKGVEHRLEEVAVVDGVRYINNSMCTNVDAAVRSVEAIEEPQIVIAGGKDKGSDYAPLGEAFKRKAKHVVLIGADAQLIQDAASAAGFGAVSRAGSMREAVAKARELAEPGDVVVLTPACASFDMFNSFEHRGQVFKESVREFDREGRLRR